MKKCKEKGIVVKYHDWDVGAGISDDKDNEIGVFLYCIRCGYVTEVYYKIKSQKRGFASKEKEQ